MGVRRNDYLFSNFYSLKPITYNLKYMANEREYPRTKEGSKIGKIVVDRDLCITAVSCIAVADAMYQLDNEAKVVVTDANAVDDETLIMSAESCPTKAIHLYDTAGNKIFPK